MVHFGWEGVNQAGGEGRAELGNGIATPVVAGKGAIHPADPPPFNGVGGRESQTSQGRYIPTGHDRPPTVHSQGASPVERDAKIVQRVFSWGLEVVSQYSRILRTYSKTSSAFARAAHLTMVGQWSHPYQRRSSPSRQVIPPSLCGG